MKKIKVRLLDNCNSITTKRRDGNTIRLIDTAIQLLFAGYIVIIEDHNVEGRTSETNEKLANRIMDRLSREHDLGVEYNRTTSEMHLFNVIQ